MWIIAKYILKNVSIKPVRSLLIIFCITICAIAAMVTLDMSKSVGEIMKQFMGNFGGSGEFIVTGSKEQLEFLEDASFPKSKMLQVMSYGDAFYSRIDGEYSFVKEHEIMLVGADMNQAAEFQIVSSANHLTSDQTIITKNFADQFLLKKGEKVHFHDVDGELHEFTIKDIENNAKELFGDQYALLSPEGMNELGIYDENVLVLLDVLDDKDIKSVKNLLEQRSKMISYQYLYDDELIEGETEQIKQIFSLILAICLLMVIFVTISVSNRIMCERMTVIGTFYSLGISKAKTLISVLSEMVFYGLCGGTIGVALYMSLRNTILEGAMQNIVEPGMQLMLPDIKIGSGLLVVLTACVIVCVCSIKPVLENCNVSIRDIIFNTKDTKYELRRARLICGSILFVLCVCCFIFQKDILVWIISFLGMGISMSLLYPYFIICIGKMLSTFYEKRGKYVSALAITEGYTKKNSVGTAVLIGTCTMLCFALFFISMGVVKSVDKDPGFDCDVQVSVEYGSKTDFEYLERQKDVSMVEYVYMFHDTVNVNGEECMLGVFCAPKSKEEWKGIRYFNDVAMPVNENEIVITKKLARRFDLKVGDHVTMEFLADMYLPVILNMKVSAISDNLDTEDFVISDDLYNRIYPENTLEYVNVFTKNPNEILDMILKYSASYICGDDTNTKESAIAKNKREAKNIVVILSVIMILGVVITFVGSSSNQMIAFESRKREFAMLLSSVMTRTQLAKTLVLETMYSTGIVMIIGYMASFLLVYPISRMLEEYNSSIILDIKTPLVVILMLVLWVVFSFLSIVPIRSMKKMNIAEEIKCE
ncbi:MAG: ABC transporter permease [Eubacteriales bacterium]|nr:ABC transporter permease [Eubacteriales bacterium]